MSVLLTTEIVDKILDIADDMHQELEDCGFNPPEWFDVRKSFSEEVLRRFNEENN